MRAELRQVPLWLASSAVMFNPSMPRTDTQRLQAVLGPTHCVFIRRESGSSQGDSPLFVVLRVLHCVRLRGNAGIQSLNKVVTIIFPSIGGGKLSVNNYELSWESLISQMSATIINPRCFWEGKRLHVASVHYYISNMASFVGGWKPYQPNICPIFTCSPTHRPAVHFKFLTYNQ